LVVAVAHPRLFLNAAAESSKQKGRLWSAVAANKLGAPDQTRRIQGKYLTLRLDRRRLADLLARAPRERAGQVSQSDLVIELPWPDGSFKSFRVEEAAIIEPGLKARCPDFKSYRGRGMDHKYAFAQFELSPSGFRARIDADDTEAFIEPYSPEDKQNLIVYYVRDWRPGPERTEIAPAARQAGAGLPSAGPASPAECCAASIEEIAIERLCRGCENRYKLTFRRNGGATLTLMGGLSIHTCRGSVTAEAFARLAALLQNEGFFDLNESYSDPRIADGGTARTTVVVDGRQKAVQNSNQAGPPNLKAIEDAIDALGEKTSWAGSRPPKTER
jgi:hypothetical protein